MIHRLRSFRFERERFKRYNIKTKVILVFAAYGILLMTSFLFPAYWIGRSILERRAMVELRSISEQKSLTLDSWLDNTIGFVGQIANYSDLRDGLKVFFDAPIGSDARRLRYNDLVHDLQAWVLAGVGFEAISVIEAESGTVIASTLTGEVGADVSQMAYFREGRAAPYVQNPYLSTQLEKPMIRISLPVTDSAGELRAVLSVRMGIERLNAIVQRGVQDTPGSDVYLVNRAGQVIVRPRFYDQSAVLHDTLHTGVTARCAAGESGETAAADYRGVPVITAFTWLPERELCLIVEKDRAEAYADIRRFSGAILLAAGMGYILAVGASLFLSRRLTGPLVQLSREVERFGRQDFNSSIKVQTNDEIGDLAQAFNRMAQNLSAALERTRKMAIENLALYHEASDRARQIEEERAFISKLFDTSSSLIVVIDREGRIVRHNRACETLTGLKHEEINGKYYEELQNSPKMQFETLRGIDRVFASQFPNYYESDITLAGGERRKIAWTNDVITNAAGEREFMIAVGMDVTDLKRVEEALRDTNRNFSVALATAPIAVFTTGPDLRVKFINSPYTTFTPEEVLGKRVDEFYPIESARRILDVQEKAVATGLPQRGLVTLEWDNALDYYLYYIDPILDDSGAVTGLACAGYDITELKRTEQELLDMKNNLERLVVEQTHELRQSQAILRTMLDGIPEVAALLDRDGVVLTGNQAMARSLGRPIEELTGKVVFDYFPQEVAAMRRVKVAEVFASGQRTRHLDTRGGRIFDNLFYPVFDEQGGVAMLMVYAVDVTEWVEAQDAIAAGRERLKELARKVVMAQEEERRRIASELHDEAGQALTALSISLKLVYADLPENLPETRRKLNDAVELVTGTMDQIRLLAQGLRPQSLDALGLNNTLEGCCRDFSRRTRIPIEYQGIEVDPLPDMIAISLFRFLQEALTNAARHAQAARVWVNLMEADGALTLQVEDDGVGFRGDPTHPPDGIGEEGGIGLLGMRERIEMLGGRMDIASAPGRGSCLTAVVNINGDPVERRRKHDPSRGRRRP